MFIVTNTLQQKEELVNMFVTYAVYRSKLDNINARSKDTICKSEM